MTTIVLTDGLLREALTPPAPTGSVAEMAQAVGVRTRATRQRRRRLALPWLLSPAATVADHRRAQLVRLAMALMLVALATGIVAAGARLLPPPPAPPQWLLLRQGQAFSVPLTGGDVRALNAFGGLQVSDVAMSWDGSRLSTVRGARNQILEVWDAASVFGDRHTLPVRYGLPDGLLVPHSGVWRYDGNGIVLEGRERGASRLFLLDLATGQTRRISPDGLNVDDWQLAPNDRWIEIVGQRGGRHVLQVLDLESGEARTVLESDGVTIPVAGGLGWSPDSAQMAVRIEHQVLDNGVWTVALEGGGLRRLTPEGQHAWSSLWSPDGEWIAYFADSGRPCPVAGKVMIDTWVVRSDGSDAHLLAASALPLEWADDSRSLVVESQLALPGAPLGGVIHAYVDGSPPDLLYAYADVDRSGDDCHLYGMLTKMYRGRTGGLRN